MKKTIGLILLSAAIGAVLLSGCQSNVRMPTTSEIGSGVNRTVSRSTNNAFPQQGTGDVNSGVPDSTVSLPITSRTK